MRMRREGGARESELFTGYGVRDAPAPRPCICGGRVAPQSPSREAIAAAQVAHNDSAIHRWWQEAREEAERDELGEPR